MGSNSTATMEAPVESNAATNDVSAIPRLGRGINLNTRRIIQSSVYEDVDKITTRKPIGRSEVNLQWASSASQIRDKLSFDVNASVSYGVVEIGGGVNYNTDNTNTALTKNLMAVTKVELYEEYIEDNSGQHIQDAVKEQALDDINGFYRQYGNGFIKSVTTGAKIIADVSMEFNSTTAIEKFSQHLNAGVASGTLGVDLEQKMSSEFQQSDARVTISLKFMQDGGDFLDAPRILLEELAKEPSATSTGTELNVANATMVEAVNWFRRIEKAILQVSAKLGKGFEEDENAVPAVLTWTSAPYTTQMLGADDAGIHLSEELVDEVNNWQKKTFGRMNTMLGLIDVTSCANTLGSEINLIPAFQALLPLRSREKINELQAVLYKGVLNVLYANNEDDARDAFEKLKGELKSGDGIYGTKLRIGETPLETALNYVDQLRSNCWIYCSGSNDHGAVQKRAIGLMTSLSNTNMKCYEYNDVDKWQNQSISDALTDIKNGNGVWTGNGTANQRARVGAPWNFEDKMVTPLYPGINPMLQPTDYGLVAININNGVVQTPQGFFKTENNSESVLCANANAILKITPAGLQCVNTEPEINNSWGCPWPNNWTSVVRSAFTTDQYVDWFTDPGAVDRYYLPWKWNNWVGSVHSDVPNGGLQEPTNIQIQLHAGNVWATQFTDKTSFDGVGIESGPFRELKNIRCLDNPTPPTKDNYHRFIKLDRIWDENGRIIINTRS